MLCQYKSSCVRPDGQPLRSFGLRLQRVQLRRQRLLASEVLSAGGRLLFLLHPSGRSNPCFLARHESFYLPLAPARAGSRRRCRAGIRSHFNSLAFTAAPASFSVAGGPGSLSLVGVNGISVAPASAFTIDISSLDQLLLVTQNGSINLNNVTFADNASGTRTGTSLTFYARGAANSLNLTSANLDVGGSLSLFGEDGLNFNAGSQAPERQRRDPGLRGPPEPRRDHPGLQRLDGCHQRHRQRQPEHRHRRGPQHHRTAQPDERRQSPASEARPGRASRPETRPPDERSCARRRGGRKPRRASLT